MGLVNDYFSFDREYDEFQASGESQTLTNSVWLHMEWHNVDIAAAKRMVKQAVWHYERRFLDLCAEYRCEYSSLSDHVDRHLRALAYQVSGNVVWSLNCPRYHPDCRYDPNAGLEDSLTDKKYCESLQHEVLFSKRDPAGDIYSYEAEATALRHQRRESTDLDSKADINDGSSVHDHSSHFSLRYGYSDV